MLFRAPAVFSLIFFGTGFLFLFLKDVKQSISNNSKKSKQNEDLVAVFIPWRIVRRKQSHYV